MFGRSAAWFDKSVVDGAVNLSANGTGRISEIIRNVQSGRVQGYALYFFTCIIALALLFIYVWK